MSVLKKISILVLPIILVMAAVTNNSCNIYKFNEATVPDSIKIVKVTYFENRATYINPQLSPQLTDKLRQKIVSQTRLKQTSGDNADWEIGGTITEYAFSTAGISNQQTSTNRINVSVHIILNKIKDGTVEEYDVSRNFDFPASQSLQQAESNLLTEMVRGITDDIFNRIFSNW
ncbi:MAG TPA: LPS assembly lipoprotein LptE [Chitinophagaceae bacterium]